jgi:S-formylglutathione hydrolase FrmB
MKKIQSIIICLAVFLIATQSFAARVDTVMTYSAKMNKTIPAIVVTPDHYSASKQYPVVYLLHGYSGDYTHWMAIAGDHIRQTADREELIIVSPDGGYSSWYFDVEGDPECQYETYIAHELTQYIDQRYSTLPIPQARAITGLSMGGHGALYLAIRHPNIFHIAGSMSGGVDIRPFPLNWDLAKRLGSYDDHPDRWDRHTVLNLTSLIVPGSLQIIIDCGTDDFFHTVNLNLHQKLLENNIAHTYISRPGRHDAPYWNNAIRYQLLFIAESFRSDIPASHPPLS